MLSTVFSNVEDEKHNCLPVWRLAVKEPKGCCSWMRLLLQKPAFTIMRLSETRTVLLLSKVVQRHFIKLLQCGSLIHEKSPSLSQDSSETCPSLTHELHFFEENVLRPQRILPTGVFLKQTISRSSGITQASVFNLPPFSRLVQLIWRGMKRERNVVRSRTCAEIWIAEIRKR